MQCLSATLSDRMSVMGVGQYGERSLPGLQSNEALLESFVKFVLQGREPFAEVL